MNSRVVFEIPCLWKTRPFEKKIHHFEIGVALANITSRKSSEIKSRVFYSFHCKNMAPRQSRRLRGLDAEIVPETARDKHCVFCLTDGDQGFNIIGGNVLRFPCCKKFAHRSCQREWERNSPLCPHCRRKLGDELTPVELTEPCNREVSPWQWAINALQEAIQDREGVKQQINAVSLTFYVSTCQFQGLLDYHVRPVSEW